MEVTDIYSILKNGTREQIRTLIEEAPDNGFKTLALNFLDPRNPGLMVVALTNMVMEYCNGSDPEFGAAMAEATHRIAQEIFTQSPDKGGLLATTLSNLAAQHLNALNYLGQSEEVLKYSGSYLTFYKNLGEMENYPSIAMATANALFNLNRIDEARTLLEATDCRLSPGSQIEKDRLLRRIDEIQQGATQVSSPQTTPQTTADLLKKSLADTDLSFMGEAQELFKNFLDNSDQYDSLDPQKHADFNHLSSLLDYGENFLMRGKSSDSEIGMRKKCRDATAIFHPDAPRKPTRQEILSSLDSLQEVYDWAKNNNSKDHYNDSLWGMYLCHSRLEQDSQAADALIELRTSLEAQRAGTVDPLKRGGAFSTYSQLFNVLCERLSNSGRYRELLETIEASKGRAIADILTRKQNRPVPDADVYGAVSCLSEMTRQHNFNFLSFYLDRYEGTATIYAVMACSNGETHGTEPITLLENDLDRALKNLDPSRWGKPEHLGKRIPDASQLLQPLTRLIDELYKANTISEGEHICYTSDEQLNNLPLHYLPFAQGRLIDYFSFSRIHNVSQLESILDNPPQTLHEAEIFVVPTEEDTQGSSWTRFEKNLYKPAEVLRELMETHLYRNTEVSYKKLRNLTLHNSILHFSTHGVAEVGDKNPFTNSGLVISDGTHLPNKENIARGDLDSILTPKKLVESDMNLQGCHVSMMACVSGLSREGLGGDALGLDWAILFSGASSVLSSHWFVSAKLAAEFFAEFYQNWLSEGLSKAEAFRKSIQTLRKDNEDTQPLQYCAFSLTGDWR